MIGVVSPRGGLGVTTLAVNLAAGLHNKTKGEVIAAEMLPGQGTMSLEMGVTASKGLVDLLNITKPTDLTPNKVRESLTQHGSGLKLLLASDRPRDMHLISQVANYETSLALLAGQARFVVLDLGVGIQPFAQKILPWCHEVLILLEGAPNTIIHTKALIDDITSMGVNKKSVNVVLNNRIRSDTQLPSSQVQVKLNHKTISTLTDTFYSTTSVQFGVRGCAFASDGPLNSASLWIDVVAHAHG